MNFIAITHSSSAQIGVIVNCSNCSTTKDQYGRIFVPNKMEDVNLKPFTLITRANESRHLQYIFRMSVDMNLMVGNKT